MASPCSRYSSSSKRECGSIGLQARWMMVSALSACLASAYVNGMTAGRAGSSALLGDLADHGLEEPGEVGALR